MKTGNLKISKKQQKATRVCDATEYCGPEYPWGTNITLDDGAVEKVPGADDLKSGKTVTIYGKALVTEVTDRTTDRAGSKVIKSEKRVTLQITDLGIETGAEFKKGFNDEKEED